MDLYPQEVPNTNYKEPRVKGDTPYLCDTKGTIKYKKGAIVHSPTLTQHYTKATHQLQSTAQPQGYIPNIGVNYIRFPIVYEGKVILAKYIQVIYHPEPIVLGIINQSDHIYS